MIVSLSTEHACLKILQNLEKVVLEVNVTSFCKRCAFELYCNQLMIGKGSYGINIIMII